MIMKKIIILLLSIFILFVISAVILIYSALKSNNTLRVMGYILLAVVSLLNLVVGFIRLKEGK
jgi:predicted membrane channel-forming protein YqfA (hemolysin III family)